MLAGVGIPDVWTYLLGTIAIVLLPGPNSLFVLATAAQRGIAAGYRAACGVFLGDSVLMLATALGVASLLHTFPVLFILIKSLGAAYLVWLGVNMLRGVWKKMHQTAPMDELKAVPKVVAKPLTKAFLLSLSNPKAILFFVSFFIQFVDPKYAYPGLSFLILAVILQVISFVYLSSLIFTGARLAQWFAQRKRLAAGATTGVGALFVGFGVKLATATLS